MERVLVTGSQGQLGLSVEEISSHYQDQCCFFYTDVEELDITQFDDVFHYCHDHNITVIINAAAYTAVDLAEDFPEKCYAINRDGVKNLATAAEKLGIFMVHISTDYVFDGNSEIPYIESDHPNPISVYGKSKLEGELIMKRVLNRGVIIRTSWLYSIYGKNFLKTMIELSGKQKEIQVVADQYGTPTCGADLAKVIMEIVIKKDPIKGVEIFHYSNSGSCSWFDFAIFIISKTGADCQVRPISSTEYKTKAKRPKHSEFNKSKVKNFIGIEIPKWELSAENTIKRLI